MSPRISDENKELYNPAVDRMFQKPIIDTNEKKHRFDMRSNRIDYTYIHGKFEGTNVKFMFCFPEQSNYDGRFFHHLSPFPGPDEEIAALEKTGEDDFIAFSLTHGACYVESNMGSSAIFGGETDSSIFYRSSAAVAWYCRTVAKELFGEHRVYGYVFGGSGGGYKTMSCIENTAVWDGAIPFVIGSPMSLPNCLTVWAHGSRLLRGCARSIVDAVLPGGSGDIYEGLDAIQKEGLREIVQMGLPPKMCIAFDENSPLYDKNDGSLPVLSPVVHMMDPDYFTDFWNKAGYLGTEENSSAQRDRIHIYAKVVQIGKQNVKSILSQIDHRNGTDDAWQKMMTDGSYSYIEVENNFFSENPYLKGTDIVFLSGAAKGKKIRLGSVEGKKLIPGMSYGVDNFEDIIEKIKPGDEILIDNSDYIAIQTYHRHQVPDDLSFTAWDQFRNSDKTPKYPQRPFVISYGFTQGGCGSVQDGHIQGKVIVMNSMMDGNFPWQADWYRRKVESVKGEGSRDCFRVWFNDNTPHGDAEESSQNIMVVSYLGMLRQGLLDLAQWVEIGVEPAENTGYTLVENQIILDANVEKRHGIQPLAKLTVNGSECAIVKKGEPVQFQLVVEIPEKAGLFDAAEWCFEEVRGYESMGKTINTWSENNCNFTLVETEYTFAKTGTYFPTVRVTSNRDSDDIYTRLRNLVKMRVIVK